jgi:hypothetical protein
VLAALDAELAAASRQRGLVKPMKWSAAEATLRDMLANAIDRKVVLHASWMRATDDHFRVKLSTTRTVATARRPAWCVSTSRCR